MKKRISVISSTLVLAAVLLLGATQASAAGREVFTNIYLPGFGNNLTVNTGTRENLNYNYVHFSMYSSSSMPTINAWVVKSSGKSMLTPKYVIYKGDSNRELRYNGTVNQGTLVEVRIEARPTGGSVSGASNIL